MFNPEDHEFHEWTLADLLDCNGALTLEERLAAIADHRCTPELAKRAVLDFGRIEIDFLLQNDPLGTGELLRLGILNENSGDRSVAAVAWRLERAWQVLEVGHLDGEDAPLPLKRATEQLFVPIEQIANSVRTGAIGAFPHAWIPHRSTRTSSFGLFDPAQLNANSLRFSGSNTAIEALFRFAMLDADDLYTACSALLVEHGGRAASMQKAYEAARRRRVGDAYLFVYECLPALVESASLDQGARSAGLRCRALRTFLLKPLAELYECDAVRGETKSHRASTVLEQRLRNTPRAKTA